MQEEVLSPDADGQLWDFVSGGASAQALLLSFTLPSNGGGGTMQLTGGGTGNRGGRGRYEGGGWVKGTKEATDMVVVSLFSVEISRSNSARFTRTGDIMSPPPLLHILLLVLIVALAVLARPRSVTCILNDSASSNSMHSCYVCTGENIPH